MRTCLSPYFIGRPEPGLEIGTSTFDIILNQDDNKSKPGSLEAICNVNKAIRDFVSETILMEDMPMILSGDCLSAIGCLAGLQECNLNPNLLWFDAHGDFHTHETSLSGHLGGMPLAMISGRGNLSLLKNVNLKPISDNKIFLIGGRDLETGEKEALQVSGVHKGNRVIDILNELPKDTGLWVHFDTDYINPIDAPAMRYTATGGLSAIDTKADLAMLSKAVKIYGISVSAWAPELDSDSSTATTCWNVISPLMQ
jgi:arginase